MQDIVHLFEIGNILLPEVFPLLGSHGLPEFLVAVDGPKQEDNRQVFDVLGNVQAPSILLDPLAVRLDQRHPQVAEILDELGRDVPVEPVV